MKLSANFTHETLATKCEPIWELENRLCSLTQRGNSCLRENAGPTADFTQKYQLSQKGTATHFVASKPFLLLHSGWTGLPV